MKKIQYIILLILTLSLFSCADSEPTPIGKLDIQVEATGLTSTSAIVTVTIPKTSDNIIRDLYYSISLYLSEKSLTSPTNLNYEEADELFHDNINLISKTETDNEIVYTYLVYNLIQNKTYYIVLRPEIDLCNNGSTDSYIGNYYYYTGYSFSTATEGDVSSMLSGISCTELLSTPDETYIQLKLPENIISSSNISLSASLSPDMSDPIYGYHIDGNSGYANEWLFSFPSLKEGEYYFQVTGFLYYKYYSEEIRLGEHVINLPEKVIIKSFDLNKITCEVETFSQYSAELVVKIPSSLGRNWTFLGTARLSISSLQGNNSISSTSYTTDFNNDNTVLHFNFYSSIKKGIFKAKLQGSPRIDLGDELGYFNLGNIEIEIPGEIDLTEYKEAK